MCCITELGNKTRPASESFHTRKQKGCWGQSGGGGRGGGLASAESGLAVIMSKQDVILYVCQVTSLSPKNFSGVGKPK